jgi:hypothetical protein
MSFNQIAPQLMSRLQSDYGLTREQAAGFVGNLAHESGGFGTLQEVKPIIPGSRGGYGYAQWTGPRRRAYEAWTGERGMDPASFEAKSGRNELHEGVVGQAGVVACLVIDRTIPPMLDRAVSVQQRLIAAVVVRRTSCM